MLKIEYDKVEELIFHRCESEKQWKEIIKYCKLLLYLNEKGDELIAVIITAYEKLENCKPHLVYWQWRQLQYAIRTRQWDVAAKVGAILSKATILPCKVRP